MNRSGTSAVAVLWTIAVLASCSSDVGSGESLPPIGANASARWPHETLSDWVSYGDAIVIVEVIDEAETAPTPDELERGEGLVGRTLTAEVEAIVWQHPQAARPPNEFRFDSLPWALENGEKRPMAFAGAVRPEVGGRYLVVVADLAGEGWIPLNPAALVEVVDGHVQDAPADALPAVEALSDRDVSVIEAEVWDANPDPVAEATRPGDADARWRAVAGDQEPPTTTS